jgi:hypothetical protein
MTTFIAPAPVAAPAALPSAYAAAAKAKLKRDRESYAAFRAVDQQQHDRAHRQRVTDAVAAAEDDLRLWREDLETLEPEAAEALAGFRAAEDRARETREHARQQLAEYERVKGKGSAKEETDALILADTADTVAADAERVMEGKQAELTAADGLLAEAREGLATAERHLDKIRAAAEIPAGTAPISDVTIRRTCPSCSLMRSGTRCPARTSSASGTWPSRGA